MSQTLDKTFDPAAIEARWYAHWEGNGLFRPHRPNAEPYTIVNPPPNVTGSLHIGHALDNTLQDVMVRYERLRGKDALWVVGTDHAGIATQMVVERQLEARQDKRTNYSREEFIGKVWEWKEESGGAITRQLRRLGCSMDWSREQFTMDPHFTKAVIKVFVDLYNKGLIYRDKRLVNWDPKLKTAISDLEVETREIKGHFWHFKYPLADGVLTAEGKDHLVVATTRPETMLADMAVAVHPGDARYAGVVGKEIVQPITGRRFKVVADEHADPELGSGVVKITPGHDFNDFEVGKRCGMKAGEMLNMLNAEARVTQTTDGLIPAEFLGLDRFEARALVVERMKQAGCLVPFVDKDGEKHDAEPRTIATPFGDRGGVVIEPWLTDQWYVDAEALAKKPIEAVKSGEIEIVPKAWEKTFFNWMENIQPWCVSRQLWWGHRIPAWYADDGEVFVAETEEEAQALAGNRKLTRDEDVLDTWFSSALWPFATLGWPASEPNQNPFASSEVEMPGASVSTSLDTNGVSAEDSLLARHYPNDLLISGFDILFFWDARMAMMGYFNMGERPWKRLYLHGLVRAADGQKMSKSKGNVVDPLGLIDRYGADALRFFMCAMESQGRDIKMDDRRVEGYRNFATKLWNAARFCQANGIGASHDIAAPEAKLAVNRWIIGEVAETQALLDKALADLRFDAAANAIYHFVWDRFCDWYLELVKPVLSNKAPESPPLGEVADDASASADGGGEASAAQAPSDPSAAAAGPHLPEGEYLTETKAVAGWALDQILVMLHPFMPFVTEELWNAMGERRNYPLINARWPQPGASVDREAKAEIDWLIRFVSEIRSARAEMNVPPSVKSDLWVLDQTKTGQTLHSREPERALLERFERNRASIARMARLKVITFFNTGTQYDMETGESYDRTKGYHTIGDPCLNVVIDEQTYLLPLQGLIDFEAEKARLAKALETSAKEAKSLEGRLANPSFVERAKPEAVEKARADHAHHAAEVERLTAALARLG